MKVFKFGGASINSTERFINTGNIIESFKDEKILIVVSAMGKTTNALESVVQTFFSGDKSQALQEFDSLKNDHLEVLNQLCQSNKNVSENPLSDFFTEIEWLLNDKPVRNFDYYYDQVVCCGELLSSSILYQYLRTKNLRCSWVDVRDIIRTDNNFRDASIDWDFTSKRIHESIVPFFENNDIVVTQGFIGATDENESTTLGREGSDFSAAIFANLMNAENVTIWKDVDAVMSADPKKYPEAAIISELSYTEVIEMAYYGAQVIHPKTIKPLQNKNIPLLVKSFINKDLKGTVISKNTNQKLPPIIVDKNNQVLMKFKSKDFSFIEDKPIHQLHEIFNQIKIKPNLSQHTAISLLCCFDNLTDKIEKLAFAAANLFDVEIEKDLTLVTIRHYDERVIEKLSNGKSILVEQKTQNTIQMVCSVNR